MIVVVSLLFTVSRFWAPGHVVSGWGTWEALAHLWMGVLLTLFVQAWADKREAEWQSNAAHRGASRWFWLLFVCWFVPSMVELVLFLVGPFNPSRG
jgi:hypothetical protein